MIMYVVIGIVVAVALLLCLCLAIASFSSENFYEKLKETQQLRNTYGITTLEYVSAINKKFFDGRLRIARCAEYNDHYSTGIVALSDSTMASNSLASLATVSHELGHAKQDNQGDKLKRHWSMRRTGKICGLFFLPVLLAGAVLSLLNVFGVLPEKMFLIIGLVCLGVGFLIFCFALFLKFKEIQIEKEASVFALDFLREVLTEPEIKHCVEFLNSARLTYWAVFFKTLLGWTFLTKKDRMF